MLAAAGSRRDQGRTAGGDVIRQRGDGQGRHDGLFLPTSTGPSGRSSWTSNNPPAWTWCARLAADADVFVQNFRPGVVERLGLGPDELCAANPSLVYVSITGFGRTGPLARSPPTTTWSRRCRASPPRQADRETATPALVRHGIVDKATGYTVAQAVTAALFARSRTGIGTRVEVSMLDVALNFLWPDGMMNHTCLDQVTDRPPDRQHVPAARRRPTASWSSSPSPTTSGSVCCRRPASADLLEDPRLSRRPPTACETAAGPCARSRPCSPRCPPQRWSAARPRTTCRARAIVAARRRRRPQPQVVATASLEETVDPRSAGWPTPTGRTVRRHRRSTRHPAPGARRAHRRDPPGSRPDRR